MSAVHLKKDVKLKCSQFSYKGEHKHQNQLGNWSLERGLEIAQPNLYERRKDFGGISLTNLLIEAAPYFSLVHDDDDDDPKPEAILDGVGLCMDLSIALAETLNFVNVIKVQEDGQYGTLLPNGENIKK